MKTVLQFLPRGSEVTNMCMSVLNHARSEEKNFYTYIFHLNFNNIDKSGPKATGLKSGAPSYTKDCQLWPNKGEKGTCAP